ncbi:hypothetical protein ACDZ28_00925 (plasmid) [Paenibacillus sp. RS8]
MEAPEQIVLVDASRDVTAKIDAYRLAGITRTKRLTRAGIDCRQ